MPGPAATDARASARASPTNRSLARGGDLLRAFRPGSELLGNGELAERTGLPKSTVSRLTQTLVAMGLLQAETAARAYRLAPAVLSLAHAMRSGSRVLAVAAPLMRALAERERVNVGLAAPDRDEMVYLESIRYSCRAAFRNVVSGQRVPIELTSLGRAYLAVAPEAQRKDLMRVFKRRRPGPWPALEREIAQAIDSVRERDYCIASWQPEVVALATPLRTRDAVYVLNLSLSTAEDGEAVAQRLAPKLLALRGQVLAAWDR